MQGVDSGPPAVLLVSLVDEEGADVEKKLVELIPTLSLSQSEEVERSDSGSAASQSHSTSVADSMTVCVTFVSEEGIVFGHDVSPGTLYSCASTYHTTKMCELGRPSFRNCYKGGKMSMI